MTRCFLIEQTGESRVTASTHWGTCAKATFGTEHRAMRVLYEGSREGAEAASNDQKLCWQPFHAVCQYCGADGDLREPTSTGQGRVWIRRDTGQRGYDVRTFGVGAMYYADWQHWTNAEGRKVWGFDWDNLVEPPLHVITPGGEWCIDSRASNCTMREDKLHRCWVRHGAPPDVTVDKHGPTCAAGAGSIMCGTYHGFLQNGSLT